MALIAMLSNRDLNDWSLDLGVRPARVSGDGRHMVFVSSTSLTGYDNAGFNEVYEYTAPTVVEEGKGEAGGLVCVSCNPSGAPPIGPSSIPGANAIELVRGAVYQSRVLSDDGSRLFFDSDDALVTQDTNGHQDVYEYENGHVFLISGGGGDEDSSFVDASGSGDDVFFMTGESLVPQDPGSIDLYDARVGSDNLTQLAPPVCSGTGCQGLPGTPPIFATPSSETFNGVGNFNSFVKTSIKQHKKKAKPKKHKKKAKSKKHKKKKHMIEEHASKSTVKGERR
jgi:hypothetical protein